MRDISNKMLEMKPALLMVTVQIAYTIMNVFYKLALNDGMNVRVAAAYRLIFAFACAAPLALIFERKNRPKLTWRVIVMSFFCGLFGGSLFQNLYFESLQLISATFASAAFNLVPGVTFILAVCCGYERLNLHRASGKAKVFGTLIGIGGVMLLAFLKGVEINMPFHIHLLHKKGTSNDGSGSKVLGIFCGLASCLCYALWLIVQAKMSKEYPGQMSSTALMSLMGSIQATVFALSVEKDWSQWRLGWSIRLLNAAYSGIVASGLMVIVIAWCVRMKGPLYASVFNPLMLVLVAIVGAIMLDENLYLGSVIGAVLIIIGLYMVLWGKSKESKKVLEIIPEPQEIEIVVTSDQSEINNNNHQTCTNKNCVVGKDDDKSSKSEHQRQDTETKRKEEMDSSLVLEGSKIKNNENIES